MIYKISPRAPWEAARVSGAYEGSPDDIRDGYIHFSTRAQLPETLAKYYAGQTDVLLIALESEALGPSLRWEAARGGLLFPHLYAPLPTNAALSIVELQLGAEGVHILPEDLT